VRFEVRSGCSASRKKKSPPSQAIDHRSSHGYSYLQIIDKIEALDCRQLIFRIPVMVLMIAVV
jgi:hypothetical protein